MKEQQKKRIMTITNLGHLLMWFFCCVDEGHEVSIMRAYRKIRLNPEDVTRFVETTSRCNFDVDIAYNRFTIDAKSILGILAMDLNQLLTVSYDGYNEGLETFLNLKAIA